MATLTCSDESIFLVGVIAVIPCIIIISLIIYKSLKEVPKLTKLCKQIKSQYYVNCTLSLPLTFCGMPASSIACITTYNAVIIVILIIYLYLYTLLLIEMQQTFMLRLHFAFKESVYRLTTNQWGTLFIAWICLLFFAVNASSFYTVVIVMHYISYYTLAYIFIILGGFVYIFITTYCIYLFAQKILSLAKLNATSMRDVVSDNNKHASEIKLNEIQIKLLYNTARYISLLSIAIISSAVTLIFVPYFGRSSMLFLFATYCDCTVNVICFYLQYPFATKHYDKYCVCLKKCWNGILNKIATKDLQKRYRDHHELNDKNHVNDDGNVTINAKDLMDETEDRQ